MIAQYVTCMHCGYNRYLFSSGTPVPSKILHVAALVHVCEPTRGVNF